MLRPVRTIVFLLAVLAALMAVRSYMNFKHTKLPVLAAVPEFSLHTIGAADIQRRDLSGAVWLVSFFFTSCPHVCPQINGKLAKLNRKFASNPVVKLLSISVDPENDTPARLHEYAKKFGAEPAKWVFAYGDMKQVQDLAAGILLDAGKEAALHTTRVAVVDHSGQVRALVDGLDLNAEQALADAAIAALGEHL